MNGRKFAQLPPDVRRGLEAIGAEVEAEMVEHFKILTAREEEAMRKLNVQIFKLPPDQAKQYLDLAYDSMWKRVLGNAPVLGARLKELTYDGRQR
jgi:TRAP-type C4-dicarboxylate transport system substrate-binding protein